MSEISQVLKLLCGGPAARQPPGISGVLGDELDPVLLKLAFSALLDGGASDMEAGALIAAVSMLEGARDVERYAPLLLSLLEVVQERLSPLPAASSGPVVVVPNYADTCSQPLLPALSILLQRIGVKVLVHGALESAGGLFTTGVLRELGVLPATTRSVATRNFSEKGLALVPIALIAPGLANVLAMRNQLGVTTPAQRVANVLTWIVDDSSSAVHVFKVPGWLQAVVTGETCFLRVPAILAIHAGPEASVQPATILQADVQHGNWVTLFEREDRARPPGNSGSSWTYGADLPAAWDTKAWSVWTRRVLEGKAPLPVSLLHMLAACLVGSGYARDINEAKAVAAVVGGSGGLAAA